MLGGDRGHGFRYSAVCVHPARRGHGLGVQVTKAAFGRVDGNAFPVSVYQTQVVKFYKKLGAEVCQGNTWVDSKNVADPKAHPWAPDETSMYYPAAFNWSEDEIDVNGGKC